MNDYDLAELAADRLLSSLRGENLARIKRLSCGLRLACLVAGLEFLVIVVGAIFAF